MREPLKDRIRLEHILTAINNIFQYTDGKIVKRIGLSKDSHGGNVLFPPWECFVPTVGTFHSHGGNPNSGCMRFIDKIIRL